MSVVAPSSISIVPTGATSEVAIERERRSSHSFTFKLGLTLRVWRLRRQMCRWCFPSERAIRFGGSKGLDDLFRQILGEQFRLEMGTELPADIALTNLAGARAEMLPRALARWSVYLLVDQHVIATLHRLLARGDYDVCRWVRVHYRPGRIRRALGRLTWWRVTARSAQDPVERFRTAPQAFASFVWSQFWALPELEETLDAAMPSGDPTVASDRDLGSDAVTTAVHVATKLDTDHSGWSDPGRFLRELHSQIRGALLLMPGHPMVQHVHDRSLRAARRFGDFEEAYGIATAHEPPPEWVSAALDAFDASDVRRHGADQVTKIVRRIACRLWVTGNFPMPERDVSAPPSSRQRPAPRSGPAIGPAVHVVADDPADDPEVGF